MLRLIVLTTLGIFYVYQPAHTFSVCGLDSNQVVHLTNQSPSLLIQNMEQNECEYPDEMRSLLLLKINSLKSDHDTIPISNSPEEINRDLMAQETMAYWSKPTFYVTLFSSIVSLLGFILLIYNLKENRKAYEVDSAAFLTLIPITSGSIDTIKSKPVLCEIKNSGRGPATITQICRIWQSMPPNDYPDPVIDSNETRQFSIPIGPQGTSPPLLTLSSEVIETTPGNWLYFMGYVDYLVDKTKYRSGFCYVIRPDRLDAGLHAAFIPHNSESYWFNKTIKS